MLGEEGNSPDLINNNKDIGYEITQCDLDCDLDAYAFSYAVMKYKYKNCEHLYVPEVDKEEFDSIVNEWTNTFKSEDL